MKRLLLAPNATTHFFNNGIMAMTLPPTSLPEDHVSKNQLIYWSGLNQIVASLLEVWRTTSSCGWLKTSTTGCVRFNSRVLHWVEPHCSAEERTPEASIMVVLLCVFVHVCVCVYWYREPGQYSTHLVVLQIPQQDDSDSSHDPRFLYKCDIRMLLLAILFHKF